MKRSILALIVLCCFYLPVRAQTGINSYVDLNEQFRMLPSEGTESADYKGSPYWEDQFVPGKISEEGKKGIEAYLRYNILKDQVEIKVEENEDEVFVLPRSKDVRYDLEEYSYKLMDYQTEEGDLLTGYLLDFFHGDDLIFVGKPTAKVSAAQKAQTGYDRPKPATVRVRSHYYLGVGEEPLREVRLKEKDFRKILGDGIGMKSYFEEHKVRSIDDIVEMLQFYEENN